MNGPRIELHHVSKSYPLVPHKRTVSRSQLTDRESTEPRSSTNVAVSDVSLVIEQGTRLGIVGRNGAGKSTLLHLIAGLTDPTSGELKVVGSVTAVMTLGIGLREDLSGRENIYLDGEIQGRTRADVDKFVDRIIEFAELGRFIDYPLRTYSTGMKARLAFSMISHIEPEILIIDETLSVGDAAFSKKATQKIREICETGKIVIVVSHSMGAIREICNRSLWMNDGKVVMDGSPQTVTDAYINAVRSDDEAELLKNFRDHVGTRSLQSNWEIEDATLLVGVKSAPAAIMEAGDRLRIRILARIPRDAQLSSLRLRIVRLDDQLFFDERFPCDDYVTDGRVALEVEMEAVVFGAAIYRLDISLFDRNIVSAETSTVFEVMTRNPPGGGIPMLLKNVDAIVTRI
jgi:lipopolysaccharide transport system ATP-binding protein